MDYQVKTALAGFGFGAQTFHAPYLQAHEGIELAYILERSKSLSKEKYPNAEIIRSYEALLQKQDVELVVIVTPNDQHFPMVKAALEAGKNVVVDKPFTITAEEARILTELAGEKGKMLSVFHNKRFEGEFKTVQKIVRSGILGEIVDYEAHMDRFSNKLRPKKWKEVNAPGVDLLYDIGAHLIDGALCLFGMPQSVYADMRAQRDGSQVCDNFEVILYYSALKVVLKAGMLVKEQPPCYAVYGKNGSYVKYPSMDVAQSNQFKSSGLFDIGMVKEPEAFWGSLKTSVNGIDIIGKVEPETGSTMEYYDNIYQVLSGKAELAIPPATSVDVMKIIDLANDSAQKAARIDCTSL